METNKPELTEAQKKRQQYNRKHYLKRTKEQTGVDNSVEERLKTLERVVELQGQYIEQLKKQVTTLQNNKRKEETVSQLSELGEDGYISLCSRKGMTPDQFREKHVKLPYTKNEIDEFMASDMLVSQVIQAVKRAVQRFIKIGNPFHRLPGQYINKTLYRYAYGKMVKVDVWLFIKTFFIDLQGYEQGSELLEYIQEYKLTPNEKQEIYDIFSPPVSDAADANTHPSL